MSLLTNLEVYAKYDNDFLDASGNGRHGTGVNSPTFATGKLGDCLHTTAASSQSVTHGTSVGTDSVAAMSWSVWVKPTAIGSFRTIAVKGLTTNTARILLCCGGGGVGSSSAIMCGLANGANSYGFTANGKLVNGVWAHIVMTFDGSQVGDANRLKCYVNGAQESLTFANGIPATTANNSADPLRAGATTGAGFYWDGDIDEWGTWSRALTGTEASLLYNDGIGLSIDNFLAPPDNLTAPVVSGVAVPGMTLSTTNGTWSGGATSYSYAWFSNATNSNVGGTPLSVTTSTFHPTSAEVGRYIYCEVTAVNENGSSVEPSNAFGPVVVQPPYDLTTGLEFWCKFNGNSLDSSGNMRNGTNANDPAYVTGGIDLEASSSQYVHYGNVGTNSRAQITWHSLVRPESVSDSQVIMSARANDSLRTGIHSGSSGNGSSSEVVFFLANGTTAHGTTASAPLAPGVDVAITLVFDGTFTDGDTNIQNAGRLKGYINGIQKTLAFSGTIPSTTADVGNEFRIGNASTGYFDGIVREARIYSRAMGQDDITALVLAGDSSQSGSPIGSAIGGTLFSPIFSARMSPANP